MGEVQGELPGKKLCPTSLASFRMVVGHARVFLWEQTRRENLQCRQISFVVPVNYSLVTLQFMESSAAQLVINGSVTYRSHSAKAAFGSFGVFKLGLRASTGAQASFRND